ncbi:MAG: 4'-phosphopantetheinyl transferase superfamily protein [Bacteroidaceae bacterium]|nr:4'-phosphopantetheinyl transferase superfamily protein [Bacteroidaceae bacterium]
MIKVLIDTHIDALDVEGAMSLLSEQRREKVREIRHEGTRRQSVAAYLLLCKALGMEKPVFTFTETGKPLLRDHPEVHFSMSHCRGAVAVAVSDRPVGIDIESVRERLDASLVRYTMNDDEVREIEGAEHRETAFMRLWTRKEALVKMTGEGISDSMRNTLTDRHDVKFSCHDRDGFICTVCRERSEKESLDARLEQIGMCASAHKA